MTTLFLRCDHCGYTGTEPCFHNEEAEQWTCPRCHQDESAIVPVPDFTVLSGRQVKIVESLEVPGKPYRDHKDELDYEPSGEYEEHTSYGVVTATSHLGSHYFAVRYPNGVLSGWPVSSLLTIKVSVVGTYRGRI